MLTGIVQAVATVIAVSDDGGISLTSKSNGKPRLLLTRSGRLTWAFGPSRSCLAGPPPIRVLGIILGCHEGAGVVDERAQLE